MLGLVLLCLLWGVQQATIKIAMTGVPPVLQGGLRSLGAVVLVWGWASWRGLRLFERDGTLGPGLLAGLLFALEFLLIYWGLTYTTASRSILFLYTAPFVVALGAHLLLPGERLSRLQAVGLLCAFAGVAAAFAEGLRLPTYRELAGDLMVLGGAVLWGATTLLIKTTRLVRSSPTKVLFYQLAVSAALLPVGSALLGEGGVVALSPLVLACLAYQIVVIAALSYLAWFWLIARYPAARLSAFTFLTPLFGVMAGALLLGERITGGFVAAMALVCAGIYLVNRRPALPRTT
ncbi:DMT family transporter [Azospirillum thermophilum]|uniref:EamA family transporter n=1 Tax=Azospirillum thermophilum TaxID=2202148 RepID=A0A2S2CZ97_9PROT|nr:DMT family transporter [Azospirillum thermophilum]AWK89809.1 EamA family transporter [Azospirillum thermophilum]